jgi:hypothetical protein
MPEEERGWKVSNYLVVAHQTASSPELTIGLTELAKSDPEAQLVLLVPATPVEDLRGVREGDSWQIARDTALEAKADLEFAGLAVLDMIVGHSSPLKAVQDELQRAKNGYAGIVVCTFPLGLSHWLRFDLPARIERSCSIPVYHLVAEPARVSV